MRSILPTVKSARQLPARLRAMLALAPKTIPARSHLDGPRIGGNVDHLWIRTANVARARAFYETVLDLKLAIMENAPVPTAGRWWSARC